MNRVMVTCHPVSLIHWFRQGHPLNTDGPCFNAFLNLTLQKPNKHCGSTVLADGREVFTMVIVFTELGESVGSMIADIYLRAVGKTVSCVYQAIPRYIPFGDMTCAVCPNQTQFPSAILREYLPAQGPPAYTA